MMAEQIGKSADTFYPINIRLSGKRALVYGGNKQALAEVNRLVQFGCHVDVIAQHVVAELQDLVVTYDNRITLMRRPFDETDVENLRQNKYVLVFVCGHQLEECDKVVAAAKAHNILASVADDIANSEYIVPSLIKRGHLKISVSTDSISPPLETALIQRIEANFVTDIDGYTLFLSAVNDRLQEAAKSKLRLDRAAFRDLLRSVSESEEILLALERKNFAEANHLADAIISQTLASGTEQATS